MKMSGLFQMRRMTGSQTRKMSGMILPAGMIDLPTLLLHPLCRRICFSYSGGALPMSAIPISIIPLIWSFSMGARGQSRFGGYVFGGFKNLDVQTTHPVSQSIDPDPLILYLGVELRCYLFPRLRIFSPYLAGRMSGFTLFWSFRNELITDEDITITYDYLGGIGLDAGVGVDFIQTDTFQAGILLLPQSFLFGEETARGFSNDYFNPYGTVRWSVEAGFKL